ncbi:unnamed protein product [Camellia sinensis]
MINLGETGLPYLVTLNPSHTPEHKLLKWSTGHPFLSVAASKASFKLDHIQGKRGIWFCGAYQVNAGQLRIHSGGILWKKSGGGKAVEFDKADVVGLTWMKVPWSNQLGVRIKDGLYYKFTGFRDQDVATVTSFLQSSCGIAPEKKQLSVSEKNWGEVDLNGNMLTFLVGSKQAFEVSLADVSQTQLQGKNDVILEFHKDSLMEISFHIPNSNTQFVGDESHPSVFRDKIMSMADVGAGSEESVVTFEGIAILTPRGRYNVDLHLSCLRLQGQANDFKIQYNSVVCLFLLPKESNQPHTFVVVTLDPPIRKGQTLYPHIVLQFETDYVVESTLSMNEDLLNSKYTSIEYTQALIQALKAPYNNMGVFHGDLDRSAGVQVASSATTSKTRRNDLNDNDYDAAEGSSGSPGIDDQEDLLHLNSKRLRIKAGGILLLLIYSRCKNCANVAPDVFGIEEDLEEPKHIVSVVDAYALIGDVSGLAEKIQSFFMQEVLSRIRLDFWYQVMTNQEAVECIRNIKDAKAAAKHLTCYSFHEDGLKCKALVSIKVSFSNIAIVLLDWADVPNDDLCSWCGVFCDNATLSVVSLNLSNLNLGKEISSAIGDLKNLRLI